MFYLGFAPQFKPHVDWFPTHPQCFLPSTFWWEFHVIISCKPPSLLPDMLKEQVSFLGCKDQAAKPVAQFSLAACQTYCWFLTNNKCWNTHGFLAVLCANCHCCSAKVTLFPGLTIAHSSPALRPVNFQIPHLEYCSSLWAKFLPGTFVFIFRIPVAKCAGTIQSTDFKLTCQAGARTMDTSSFSVSPTRIAWTWERTT